MIVPEYIIRDIVNQIPTITYPSGEKSVQFGWGDKKELNKYLKVKKEGSYPLIWLLSPSQELHTNNSTIVERDCNFVIATLETRSDLYNPQRYEGAFKSFLNPVTEYLTQGVRNASPTRILNDDNITITKFPNYSEDESSSKSGAIA